MHSTVIRELSSIKGRRVGELVRKGDRIGCMGSREENGDWPPHVHFQLSLERPATHHARRGLIFRSQTCNGTL